MIRLKIPVVDSHPVVASPDERRTDIAAAAVGVAVMVLGGVFWSAVTAHLGALPTLFLGVVVAACVGMQVGQLAFPHHLQR